MGSQEVAGESQAASPRARTAPQVTRTCPGQWATQTWPSPQQAGPLRPAGRGRRERHLGQRQPLSPPHGRAVLPGSRSPSAHTAPLGVCGNLEIPPRGAIQQHQVWLHLKLDPGHSTGREALASHRADPSLCPEPQPGVVPAHSQVQAPTTPRAARMRLFLLTLPLLAGGPEFTCSAVRLWGQEAGWPCCKGARCCPARTREAWGTARAPGFPKVPAVLPPWRGEVQEGGRGMPHFQKNFLKIILGDDPQ